MVLLLSSAAPFAFDFLPLSLQTFVIVSSFVAAAAVAAFDIETSQPFVVAAFAFVASSLFVVAASLVVAVGPSFVEKLDVDGASYTYYVAASFDYNALGLLQYAYLEE